MYENFLGPYNQYTCCFFERNWETIKSLKTARPFDEKFRRRWNYYLLSCKAAFDVEDLLLWQIVMSKRGSASVQQHGVNV